MNYAQFRKYDVANGVGIRTTLFLSGCTHNCPNCFNKEYQNFKYGNKWNKETEDVFISLCKNENVNGVSILGGEPFQQDAIALENLLRRIKTEVNKSVWLWTGYKWGEWNACYNSCLEYIDIIIDGKFIESKKDLSLKWRGSSNQRIIDVKKTRTLGKITERTDLY